MEDRCVRCGEIIPEGRQLCLICEKRLEHKTQCKKKGVTLCWKCSKGVRECQWMSDLKPIHGWVAEKTEIRNCNRGKGLPSYRVIKCPLFERSKSDDKN